MKRKIILFGVMLIILFALTGCGKNDVSKNDKNQEIIDLSNPVDGSAALEIEQTQKETTTIKMTVVNDFSDIAITEIYTSISGTNEWDDNCLEGRKLLKGDSTDVNIEIPTDGKEVDIYVVDEEEHETEFLKLNFNSINKEDGGTITLSENGIANIK